MLMSRHNISEKQKMGFTCSVHQPNNGLKSPQKVHKKLKKWQYKGKPTTFLEEIWNRIHIWEQTGFLTYFFSIFHPLCNHRDETSLLYNRFERKNLDTCAFLDDNFWAEGISPKSKIEIKFHLSTYLHELWVWAKFSELKIQLTCR